MSSSSHARVNSRSERRTTNDNGASQPRAPAGSQRESSRQEKPDQRRTQSPPASIVSSSQRRAPSGAQRVSRNLEERRTERVQVHTRETVTSRTRSPERRPPPPSQERPERPRPSDQSRSQAGSTRPKSQNEIPIGNLESFYGTTSPN